jgi:hypothetical protein
VIAEKAITEKAIAEKAIAEKAITEASLHRDTAIDCAFERPPFNNPDTNETGIGGRGGQIQDRSCRAEQHSMLRLRRQTAPQ